MSLSPEQFGRRFIEPYGCRKLADLGAGYEAWVTGWGVEFVLRPSDGRYDQVECNRLSLMIHRTMPIEWRTAAEVSKLREAIEELTEEIRRLRTGK